MTQVGSFFDDVKFNAATWLYRYQFVKYSNLIFLNFKG